MARRGENIYHRKDGRWEGRYIKGRKPDGKPLFGSVYGPSYGEVKNKLLPLKAAYCERSLEARCTKPFRDYLLGHLAGKRGSGIKESSYDSYFRIVHNHLLPGLGGCPMHRLTEEAVKQFLCDLHNWGLSDGTVRNIFRYLSSVTKAAVKSGVLARDVCADVAMPKPKQSEAHALSRADQQALEGAAAHALRESDYKRGAEVMIALNTGMRVGEICALRWDDVDFANEVIYVRHTLQRVKLHEKGAKTAVKMGSPKTGSSERIIPMNGSLSSLLRELRARAAGEFVVAGSRRTEFMEPRVMQYHFERMLEQARLPHAGFHTLRHSFATRCMENKVEMTHISKLLGHASVKMTSDTYVHSTMEYRRAAVRKLDGLAA